MQKRFYPLIIITAILLTAIVVSISVGPVAISFGDVIRILTAPQNSDISHTDVTIVWQLRLPRIILASVVGAGLGAAGAGFQGLFRNPLADPFVIGASSGAALGATIAIINDAPGSAWGLSGVSAAALCGSLLAVGVVYGIASAGRQASAVSLLLAGVAVSSFAGAVVSLLMFRNEEKLFTIVGWLMGSFAGKGWPTLRVTMPMVLASIAGLWCLSRSLDSLTFGEETATSLGLRLRRFQLFVVGASSLATAAAVAASGVVGFVGLIAPHIARTFVGARHAFVIPASALTGAILLLIADDTARTIAAPAELPVGVITALLGGPFFLYLLKTRQRELWAP